MRGKREKSLFSVSETRQRLNDTLKPQKKRRKVTLKSSVKTVDPVNPADAQEQRSETNPEAARVFSVIRTDMKKWMESVVTHIYQLRGP